MYEFLARLRASARAATAIEYGLILALISLAILGALTLFAGTAVGLWDNVAQAVTNA